MALLCARIEFYTPFKPTFIFGCFSNSDLWITDIKSTTTAYPATSVLYIEKKKKKKDSLKCQEAFSVDSINAMLG